MESDDYDGIIDTNLAADDDTVWYAFVLWRTKKKKTPFNFHYVFSIYILVYIISFIFVIFVFL
jgi:hypothetical protein